MARRARERAANAGAAARFAEELDLTAGGAARRAYGTEADAAAGELSDLAAGRQAIVEQRLDEVAARVVRQAAPRRGGAHRVPVDPGAVVADLDDERVADVLRAQRDLGGRRLARGGAQRRLLDAVVDRVADGVDQRRPEGAQLESAGAQAVVLDDDLDRLADALGDVAGLRGEPVQRSGGRWGLPGLEGLEQRLVSDARAHHRGQIADVLIFDLEVLAVALQVVLDVAQRLDPGAGERLVLLDGGVALLAGQRGLELVDVGGDALEADHGAVALDGVQAAPDDGGVLGAGDLGDQRGAVLDHLVEAGAVAQELADQAMELARGALGVLGLDLRGDIADHDKDAGERALLLDVAVAEGERPVVAAEPRRRLGGAQLERQHRLRHLLEAEAEVEGEALVVGGEVVPQRDPGARRAEPLGDRARALRAEHAIETDREQAVA